MRPRLPRPLLLRRGLSVPLVVGGLLGGLGCAPGQGNAPAGPPPPPVEVELHTDRESYDRYEPIRLSLVVANRGGEAVVLPFPTSQRHDVVIRDGGGAILWRWSDGRSFAQVRGEAVVEPAESLRWTVTFDGSLPPGEYLAEGWGMGPLTSLPATRSFQVR